MDIKILSRCVAYVALVGALVAAAIALNNRQYPTTQASRAAPAPNSGAPDAELAHCKAIGAEAAGDAVRKAVWQANRDCFFQSRKRYQDRVTEVVPETSILKELESAPGGEFTPQSSSTHNASARHPLADGAGQPQ